MAATAAFVVGVRVERSQGENHPEPAAAVRLACRAVHGKQTVGWGIEDTLDRFRQLGLDPCTGA